jgi:NifU-like protein involved in Fe-S cluster formation
MMSGSGSTDGLNGNEDLEALQGVKKFPVRVKCALLPWTALLEIIDRWEHAPEHAASP